MNKKQRLFVIITVIGLLFILKIGVSAATSDAAYFLSYISSDRDLYGEKYAPAQKLSNGEIQLSTGEVSINEIDVSLPGKNGLDLNIHRIYSSQETRHEMEYGYSSSKYAVYVEKAYLYNIMDGSGDQILVSFDSEAEMVDSFYSTETKLDKNLKEDVYGVDYQTFSALKSSTGTILLERDKTEYMEEIYKESYRVIFADSKREGNIYLTPKNKEWKIAMPYVYRIGSYTNSIRKIHYYRFGNEKGEVYTLRFAVIAKEDELEVLGSVFSKRIFSTDYTIEVVFDETALTHTLLLTDKEGKTYTFNLGNAIATPTKKVTDVVVTDRHGNNITYSNNEITDSYGRTLHITSDGIEILNGESYKTLVEYEAEEICDQDRDPQGLLDIFSKTKLKVLRNTSLLNDAEDCFEETVYITQAKETDSTIKYCERSLVSLLNEVTYPDGQKYIYTYEEENSEIKEPIDYYNSTYTYTVPRVKSKSEQIKTETGYVEKISRSFSYTPSTSSYVYSMAMTVKEILKTDGSKYKTITYTYDFVDRLLSKSETIGSDVLLTEYFYRQPQTIRKVSDISREDYIDFRQTPVTGIVVTENDTIIDITYMEYTKDRKPSLIQKGLQKESYIYDEAYNFVLEHTKSIAPGKELRTVNTKTADGKSIAQTQVFEVVDGVETLKSTTTYTYNTDGTVSGETTLPGITTNYTYDYSLFTNNESGEHTITASIVTTDASGISRTESVTTEYDLLGNIKKVTDGNGNNTEYSYDILGRIVEEKYADGTERSVAYDTENRTVTVTEPDGHMVAYEYDEYGKLLKTYLPDSTNQILNANTYDSLGRKIKTTVYTDSQNTVSEEYEYDSFNRITKKTDLQNDTVVETTNYSITNNIEKVDFDSYYSHETVALNGEYAYAMVITKPIVSYDATYDPYVITKADGVEIDRMYGYFDDVNFAVYDMRDVDSAYFSIRMTGTVYVILVKNEDLGTGALAATTTVTSTFAGDESFVRPKEVTKYDHSGAVIYTERRDNTTDEVLTRDEYDYDFLGNTTEYRDSKVNLDNVGEYTSRVEYNFLSLPAKEINASGNYKTYAYDELGRLLTATDETGARTTYTYDALGREIVSETDISETEKTRTEKYYDSNGNIVKERIKNNAVGADDAFKEVTYEYDNMNRLVTVKNDANIYSPEGVVQSGYISYTQYLYDDMGNPIKTVTGQTEKLDLSQTVDLPYTTTAITYEYDRFGNVTKQTNMSGLSETAAYNLIGLPTSTTDRKGVTTTYTYNAYGSPLSVSTAGMDTITYTYNVNNVLLSAQQGNDVITYEYDSLGRLTKETENGIIKTYQTDKVGNITYAEIAGVGTTYTYDNLNRMTGAAFEGGSVSYTYDNAGRLTGETKGGITTTYTYNPAGWLSSKTNSDGINTDTYALTYYADGNIHTKTENGTATTYVYDGKGQLTRENDVVYEYDTSGNRISKDDGELYITYAYYDDNLLGCEEWSDNTAVYYYYDNNGNMTCKDIYYENIIDGILEPELVNSEIMTYDPLNRMTGYQANGVNVTYTYGIDNMRKSKTVNGVTTNYIWDGGSIVAEADINNTITNRYFRGVGLIASKTGDTVSFYQTNSHGDVSKWGTDDYSYDAFGNETTETSGTNPFRYNGEYFDEESGFIYLRNRYYDPTNGRFTTEDPIQDGLNWYAYCANNPVMFVDPWGLELYLQGTGDEVQVIWQNVKELSHDELVLTQLTDANGNLTNRYIVTIGKEKTGKYESGTALIRNLIRGKHDCTVVIHDGLNITEYVDPVNARNGIGSDTIVKFNPNSNPKLATYNPQKQIAFLASRPTYIGLAHELIHAQSAHEGITYESYIIDDNTFAIATSSVYGLLYTTEENIQREELATIGLGKYPRRITENMIRAEHNLPKRMGYFDYEKK